MNIYLVLISNGESTCLIWRKLTGIISEMCCNYFLTVWRLNIEMTDWRWRSELDKLDFFLEMKTFISFLKYN